MNEYILSLMLGFGIFVSIPCWIWTLWQRHCERRDSFSQLSPEQYEDFVRRAAIAGMKYMERNGGRIHYLDMMAEGRYSDDPERFDEELRRRLRKLQG